MIRYVLKISDFLVKIACVTKLIRGLINLSFQHLWMNGSHMNSLDWDSRSSENMAAKFMKRDTFIQKVIFEQIFHFWIFLQNFNCHTSQTSIPNFCIGFWNDIGNKNLRKTIFDFYQFPVKIILVGLCLKA